MKKSKKILTVLALLFVSASLSVSVAVFASDLKTSDEVKTSDEEISLELQDAADNFISSVESELEQESTNVVEQLELLVEKYTQLLSTADEEDAAKLEALIATTNELINDYKAYGR